MKLHSLATVALWAVSSGALPGNMKIDVSMTGDIGPTCQDVGDPCGMNADCCSRFCDRKRSSCAAGDNNVKGVPLLIAQKERGAPYTKSPSSDTNSSGAVVKLTTEGSGQYKAVQQPPTGVPKADGPSQLQLDWAFGPVKITGYVDSQRFTANVAVFILGISLGNVSDDLRQSMLINFELDQSRGSTRLYLKNGNEIWVNLRVRVQFDGSFDGDYKILTM